MTPRIIALLSLTTLACATGSQSGGAAGGPSHVTYGGGDGTSCAQAVVIKGASDFEGVGAEYAWIRSHYPGAEMLGQALIKCGEHPADRLTIQTKDGAQKELFFDISESFGK
jgi:hypothetical protein